MPYYPGAPSLKSWRRHPTPSRDGIAVAASSFSVFPLEADANVFPGWITANTFGIMLSYNFTNTSGNPTAVYSSTYRFGIYTLNGSSLSLVNSVSGTFGNTAATSNASTKWNGQRLLTVHSSQWSSQPVFQEGIQYWCAAQLVPTASTTAVSVLQIQSGPNTGTSFGFLGGSGQGTSSGTGVRPYAPFQGLFNATTNAVPGSIGTNSITGISSNAACEPWLIMDTGFLP